MGQNVTYEETSKLACPRCHAKPDEPCVRRTDESAVQKQRHHQERVRAARQRKVPAKDRV